MSWAFGPDGTEYALISRDQWLELYVAAQDGDEDTAVDTLMAIKPQHWPPPEAILDELPEPDSGM
ncbi:hypothetical protein [Prauserella flavalba]|uniref:Uncharacterized protein n=1 Tax=Prauserella flavalba TaxID=1477506 RepID=A0A318L8V9_9PSEU|nr:hypothetical protein [Prauserella flavalba]PXY17336.1 hypothetical protein BA062_37640 [Prauserella flavalba]